MLVLTALDDIQRSDDTSGVPFGDSIGSATIKQDFPGFSNDPMLTEFGWSVGDDVFSYLWDDGAAGL